MVGEGGVKNGEGGGQERGGRGERMIIAIRKSRGMKEQEGRNSLGRNESTGIS